MLRRRRGPWQWQLRQRWCWWLVYYIVHLHPHFRWVMVFTFVIVVHSLAHSFSHSTSTSLPHLLHSNVTCSFNSFIRSLWRIYYDNDDNNNKYYSKLDGMPSVLRVFPPRKCDWIKVHCTVAETMGNNDNGKHFLCMFVCLFDCLFAWLCV